MHTVNLRLQCQPGVQLRRLGRQQLCFDRVDLILCVLLTE